MKLGHRVSLTALNCPPPSLTLINHFKTLRRVETRKTRRCIVFIYFVIIFICFKRLDSIIGNYVNRLSDSYTVHYLDNSDKLVATHIVTKI